ncbi:flagellar basal-body MS-ring/collar protein FliF [Aquibacillus salsiterrae]|uniref:Flagellar M-ring protein n=1 Tax=Aquibacillus salsiterrae TaxID=2950439 RepID=A0A9X3WCJ4_9BACI|nr:flagellar basal-body MS-ring/collar protein FliF [Aquibacillus salsiterrae]MDC3416398.1 flagellar M-ring protein FliF [Aquibacillus salsiterrae]
MRQTINQYKEKIINYWSTRTKKQQRLYLGGFVLFLCLIIGGSFLLNTSSMVPLYNNLSLQEVGQIKAELDTRGVDYELSSGGTTIMVPSEQVNTLLVDLAAQGIPNSGTIDYSFFSSNTSWGMTDNEFDVIKLDAMQTELGNLIKSIDGIEDANVMINKPENPVFVSDQATEASASIVIQTRPGYQFQQSQIVALYNLVSKTVPNLPTDNIVLMNQNFEYFDLDNSSEYSVTDTYTYQQNVKKDIERDIQRRVQQMVGMMVGMDKVVASVTADVDFTQENRVEEIVEPTGEMGVDGLPVSIETIKETYTGSPKGASEIGTGEGDIPNYPADGESSNGDYEMVRESINNEYNRIRKEIVESPYKLRDLGIQVAVDKAKEQNETGQVQYLSQEEQQTVEAGIASILNSIVMTSIDGAYGQVVPDEKVSIVFQEFNGRQPIPTNPAPFIPYWVYGVGAALVFAVLALIWMLRRKRSFENDVYDEFTEQMDGQTVTIPEIEQGYDSESAIRRKQIENMAKDKPEDFAKLLRTWIAED